VGRVGDALAALVAALDPDAFSAQTASAVWAGLDRVERLVAAGKTVLARRAAQAAGGADEGRRTGQSGVEELARRAGTSVGAARDSVTTSQRLVDLPVLDAALRAGELSTAQAQLIASAAAADPSAQERLVALAPRVSLPELRDECARVRAAADPDPEARNARLRAGRRLRRYTDPEGAWNLSARGTPQAGALFNAALDSIIDECFAAARAAGRREAYEAHAFDALMVMAQRATDPESAAPTVAPSQPPTGDAGVDGPAGRGEPVGDPSRDVDLFAASLPDGAPACDDHEGGDKAGGDAAPDDGPSDDHVAEPGLSPSTVPEDRSTRDQVSDDRPGDGVAADEPPCEWLRAEPNAGEWCAAGHPAGEPVNVPGGSSGANAADRRPDSDARARETVGVGVLSDLEQDRGESTPPAEASSQTRAPTESHRDAPSDSVGPALSRPRRSNPRHLALLRVDLEALRRGAVEGDELCEIAGIGPVPVSVARELLGDAVLKLVITRGVDVLNVTHLGRGPTAAQRVALAWASPGCSVEGCWRTRVEIDHREDWARTRHTRLDELDHLCAFHHDLKTGLGWALVSGTGKRTFVPPGDPRRPRHRGGSGRAGDHRDGPPAPAGSAATEGPVATAGPAAAEGAVSGGGSVAGGAVASGRRPASGGGAASGLGAESGGRDPGASTHQGDRPPPAPGRAA